MKVIQNCSLPSRSSIIRPQIFGNQKSMPAYAANTTVPKTT